IRRQLADKDPINERRKMELMLVLAHCGECEKAAGIATDLEKKVKPDAEFLIDLARTYAQCAAADGKLASRYTAEALRVLRAAVALGYRDQAYLKLEVDLDPIRSSPEFTRLVEQIHGKRKPQRE